MSKKPAKCVVVESTFPAGQPRCQAIKCDGYQCENYTAAYAGTGTSKVYCQRHVR